MLIIRQLLGEREEGFGRGEVVFGLSSGWSAGGKVLREIRTPVFGLWSRHPETVLAVTG